MAQCLAAYHVLHVRGATTATQLTTLWPTTPQHRSTRHERTASTIAQLRAAAHTQGSSHNAALLATTNSLKHETSAEDTDPRTNREQQRVTPVSSHRVSAGRTQYWGLEASSLRARTSREIAEPQLHQPCVVGACVVLYLRKICDGRCFSENYVYAPLGFCTLGLRTLWSFSFCSCTLGAFLRSDCARSGFAHSGGFLPTPSISRASDVSGDPSES